jgi:hypothetical protein
MWTKSSGLGLDAELLGDFMGMERRTDTIV